MIRQGCCWTGYSEQSYSNHVGLLLPPSFFLIFPLCPIFFLFLLSFPFFFFLPSFVFFLLTRQVSERMEAFIFLVPELSDWIWHQHASHLPCKPFSLAG